MSFGVAEIDRSKVLYSILDLTAQLIKSTQSPSYPPDPFLLSHCVFPSSGFQLGLWKCCLGRGRSRHSASVEGCTTQGEIIKWQQSILYAPTPRPRPRQRQACRAPWYHEKQLRGTARHRQCISQQWTVTYPMLFLSWLVWSGVFLTSCDLLLACGKEKHRVFSNTNEMPYYSK